MNKHSSMDSALLFAVYRYGEGTPSHELKFTARVTDCRIIDLQRDKGLVLQPQTKAAALYECHVLSEDSKEITVWYIYVLDEELVQVASARASCHCQPLTLFEARFEVGTTLRGDVNQFGIHFRVGIANHVVELGHTV